MAYREPALSGRRNERIEFKTTKKIDSRLNTEWASRTYKDKYGRECKFKSKGQYIEFVLGVLFSRGDDGWKMVAKQKLTPVLF